MSRALRTRGWARSHPRAPLLSERIILSPLVTRGGAAGEGRQVGGGFLSFFRIIVRALAYLESRNYSDCLAGRCFRGSAWAVWLRAGRFPARVNRLEVCFCCRRDSADRLLATTSVVRSGIASRVLRVRRNVGGNPTETNRREEQGGANCWVRSSFPNCPDVSFRRLLVAVRRTITEDTEAVDTRHGGDASGASAKVADVAASRLPPSGVAYMLWLWRRYLQPKVTPSLLRFLTTYIPKKTNSQDV